MKEIVPALSRRDAWAKRIVNQHCLSVLSKTRILCQSLQFFRWLVASFLSDTTAGGVDPQRARFIHTSLLNSVVIRRPSESCNSISGPPNCSGTSRTITGNDQPEMHCQNLEFRKYCSSHPNVHT